MKYVLALSLLFCVLMFSGCAGTGQDVEETPVGSVLSGNTRDPDSYLDRVSSQNAANTKAAGVNQTNYESHQHTNFGTSEGRY